ncbi:MAG: hypothetical protein ACOC9J_03435 [Persicimonas sp.]
MKHPIRPITLALWLVIVTGVFITSTTQPAVAQVSDSELQSKLDQASEDYDMLMLDESAATLDEAISKAESEGASGSMLAKLYVMRAIVVYASAEDEQKATEDFVRALEVDYDVELPSHYKNPSLSGFMEKAREQVPEPSDDADSADSAGQAGQAEGLEHEAIATARAGQALEIEGFVGAEMPVYRVFVYHRRYREDEYQRTEMEATSATRFAVELPADQVRTSQIEYYIEARDRAGESLGRAGSKSSPLAITVLGSSDLDDDGGDGDGGDGGDDGDDGDGADGDDGGDVISDGSSPDQRFYVMLAGGSGVGFLPGGNPTAHPDRDVSSGLAPAFGHGMLDFGYMITENAHVGMYFRWQMAPPQDFSEIPDVSKGGSFLNGKDECLGLGLPGDCLLGLKYRWFFKDIDRFRMYSSTGAGIGRVRHWLKLEEPYYDSGGDVTDRCAGKDRVQSGANGDICYLRDTVRPGWAHFGVGAGVMWPMHDNVDVGVDSYLTVLVPETAVNLDVNLAVNFRF